MKFSKVIQMGDSEIFIEGEMDDEGAEIDHIYHKGEEVTEMLSEVIRRSQKGHNGYGWTNFYLDLCSDAHGDYYELAAEEKRARAEHEWELRTDR